MKTLPLYSRLSLASRSKLSWVSTSRAYYHYFRPLAAWTPISTRTMATRASSDATREQIQALQKYTACDIADALLKLKVPNAGFLPDLKLFSPNPSSLKTEITIAPASTVIFSSKTGPNDSDLPETNIPAGKHWVDLTQPETIVVMKQAEGQICAILGGIMALRIKVLHGKGIVVNGRVRDIAELRETGLPIWATLTSIVGTGLEAKPHAVQVPLDINGTIIEPGDLVFGDATNGVVVIPHSKVSKVIEMLPGLVGADDRVKEDVAQGVSVQEAFKKHRGQ